MTHQPRSSPSTSGRHRSLVEQYALPPDQIEPLSMHRAAPFLSGLEGMRSHDAELVRRLVYAVGDPQIQPAIRIHPDAVKAGIAALQQGKPVITDVRMVRAGIDRKQAARFGVRLVCAMDAPGVIARARTSGQTRAVEAIRAVATDLDGAVAVIGNAPTALLGLLDLVDAGLARPALIIAMPVGFVAAAEAKEELLHRSVPYITVLGTRGGSGLAVSAANTLLRQAALPSAPRTAGKTAVLIMGHGSRAHSAGEAMEAVLAAAQARAGYDIVGWGYLEFAQPTIAEGIRRCIEAGATRIVAVPYFLHVGMHMIRDLPRVLQEARDQYPEVEFVMGHHLGLHPDLVEMLLDRIADSWRLPPIQDVEVNASYFAMAQGAAVEPDDDE